MIDADTGLPVLEKQPREVRPFWVDFTPALEESPITTIDAVDITNLGRVSNSEDVAVQSQDISGDSVRVVLAGGTDGEAYKVTVRITLADGTKVENDGVLQVRDH